MAKAAKKNTTVQTAEGNGQTEVKAMALSEKKALLSAADEANATLSEVLGGVRAARDVLSLAVKEIFEKMGTGPFEWKGEKFYAAKKGDRYFFKGIGVREVEKIG
jgi:hypothetical protein